VTNAKQIFSKISAWRFILSCLLGIVIFKLHQQLVTGGNIIILLILICLALCLNILIGISTVKAKDKLLSIAIWISFSYIAPLLIAVSLNRKLEHGSNPRRDYNLEHTEKEAHVISYFRRRKSLVFLKYEFRRLAIIHNNQLQDNRRMAYPQNITQQTGTSKPYLCRS
jgi:hypothetical protein